MARRGRRWCDRGGPPPRSVTILPPPSGWPRLSATLFYDDPAAAIYFLERAFGFVTRILVPGPGDSILHAELCYGEAVVMTASLNRHGDLEPTHATPGSLGGRVTGGLFLYVDDIEAHHAHAVAAGAQVFRALETTDYGAEYWSDRGYGATDPEGQRWWFAQRLRG